LLQAGRDVETIGSNSLSAAVLAVSAGRKVAKSAKKFSRCNEATAKNCKDLSTKHWNVRTKKQLGVRFCLVSKSDCQCRMAIYRMISIHCVKHKNGFEKKKNAYPVVPRLVF
jgi:hypothetical protein